MRRPHTLAVLAISAFALAATPALAFDVNKLGYGSLFLGDIAPLVKATPKLAQEAQAALAAANKKADEQMCESPRFPGPWQHLHGEHVAPFVCQIGAKWLQINATVRVTGPKGEAFEIESVRALRLADKITQSNVTWAWTDTDPRKRP
jgi:hypothetical protein